MDTLLEETSGCGCRYATEYGREYIDKEKKPMTAAMTDVYRQLTESGVDSVDAYNLLDSFRGKNGDGEALKAIEKRALLKKDKNLTDEQKGVVYRELFTDEDSARRKLMDESKAPGEMYKVLDEISNLDANKGDDQKNIKQRNVLRRSNLPEGEKEQVILELMTGAEQREDRVEALDMLKKEKVTVNDYLEAVNKKDEIALDTKVEKANRGSEFSYWLDKQGYSESQEATLREVMGEERVSDVYNKLVGNGVEPDVAIAMTKGLREIEPLEEDKNVTAHQKYISIADSSESEGTKRTAMNAILPAKQLEKFNAAMGAGITSSQYVHFKADISLMKSDKDENGNTVDGSKRLKVLTYIDNMNLTVEQKDFLYFNAGRNYSENTLWKAPWHGGERYGGRLPSYVADYDPGEKAPEQKRKVYEGGGSTGAYTPGNTRRTGGSGGKKASGGGSKAAAPTVKLGGTGETINPKTGFTESQQKMYEQIILSAMSGPTTTASAMGGHMSREEATAFQLKSRNR